MTHISWTDATWNPVTGCTKVSPGCAHCYIERTPPMRMAGRRFVDGKIPVTLHPDRLEIPLHWRKPRMVFVPSMGDLFHEDVPDEFIEKVWLTMHHAHQKHGHIFQVLTKRPERMGRVLGPRGFGWYSKEGDVPCPEPGIWLGVSVENQARADERIPLLLKTPAAVRFVSAEPLLGPLNIEPWIPVNDKSTFRAARGALKWAGLPRLDWCIVGGESGGPPERRLVYPCREYLSCRYGYPKEGEICGACLGHGGKGGPWRPKPEALEWLRSLRDQCQAAGVPFFFKQWGPRAGQGTLVDGREHREMPRQEVRA